MHSKTLFICAHIVGLYFSQEVNYQRPRCGGLGKIRLGRANMWKGEHVLVSPASFPTERNNTHSGLVHSFLRCI